MIDQLRDGGRRFAQWRRGIKHRFGWLAPLHVALYGGYGYGKDVLVRGRVLEEHPGAGPDPGDPRLSNLRRSWDQFESDEVPGVQLRLELGDTRSEVVSDEDGFFFARVRLKAPALAGWLPVKAQVTQVPYPTDTLPSAESSVLIPSESARFGVISDIDDTILRTHVSNKAKMLYLTLLGNALTRHSFEGTRELYRGLARAGAEAPFFYVSQSVWNIFPLLEQFIREQQLPRGPLLLRQVRLLRDPRSVPHKPAAIAHLLQTYPRLPFLLIGDSGERDLDVYLDAARRYPGRIRGILIRNVSKARRAEALRRLAAEAAPAGCSARLFDDAPAAIQHCRDLGLWPEN
jgi:phosphatidate phosphatase APP1